MTKHLKTNQKMQLLVWIAFGSGFQASMFEHGLV